MHKKFVVPFLIAGWSNLFEVIIGAIFVGVKLSQSEAYFRRVQNLKMSEVIPHRLLNVVDSDNIAVYEILLFHCTNVH
jgi:hypothetical protein